MMYKNNFVAVVKSNGKVLRETKDCVLLPFGSEYTILLKNLDSRKAVARVSVDGSDVLGGDRLIVPANSSVELKGKMSGTTVKHHFKFIKKTKEISRHRGDKPDDGLIRVEYWFEREKVECIPEIVWPPVRKPWPPVREPWPPRPIKPWDSSITWDVKYMKSNADTVAESYYSNNDCTTRSKSKLSSSVQPSFTSSGPVRNDGITVQGSRANQDFVYGHTDVLETNSHVIVLHLRGKSKKGRVQKAVNVKTRFRCPTCGRKSKSYAKWCHNCGTNLEM